MDNVSFIVNEVISTIQDYLKSVFGNVETPFTKLQGRTKWLVNQQLFLEKTWQFINRIQDVINVSSPLCSEVDVNTSGKAGFHSEGCQTEDMGPNWNTNMVQLTSSNKEIERRINTFIERKRMEIDIYNQREFSCISEDPTASTCARTDAVDVPRHGSKSLVRVSKVENSGKFTEQDEDTCRTRQIPSSLQKVWEVSHPSQALNIVDVKTHIKERLDNIQSHLENDVTDWSEGDSSTSQPVLQRIKSLENRILYLEGLSPEYFSQKQQHRAPKGKLKTQERQEPPTMGRASDIEYGSAPSDLDRRIARLRSILTQQGTKPARPES